MKINSYLLAAPLLVSFALSSPAQLFWDPDGVTPGTSVSGNWDNTTTNWTTSPDTGNNTSWSPGGQAFFSVDADYTATVTDPISVGNISVYGTAGTLTIDRTADNGLTLSADSTFDVLDRAVDLYAPIGGSFKLTKTSNGTLNLYGTNTWSGGTTLSGGVIGIGVDSVSSGGVITSGPFGSGDITTITAQTTLIARDVPRVIENPITLNIQLNISGSQQLTITNGDFKVNGGNRNLNVINTADTILASRLVDEGSAHTFTKQGAGRLILAGDNQTYLGTVTIGAGTVVVDSPTALPKNNNNLVTVNGTLDLNGFDTRVARLSGNAAGSVLLGTNTLTAGNDVSGGEFSGVISGTGGYVKVGKISQVLSGTNTFTGGITISEGPIYFPTNGNGAMIALGPGPNTITITNVGRIGVNRGIGVITNPVVLATDGPRAGLDEPSGSTFIFGSLISGSGGLYRYSQGSGNPVVTNNNTFTGGVQMDERSLVLGHSHAIGTGPLILGHPVNFPTNAIKVSSYDSDLLDANAVTNPVTVNQDFTLNATSTGLGLEAVGTFGLELSGPVTLADRTNVVTVLGSGLTKLSGVISGPGALAKAGANTLFLSAINTYTGPTIVAEGTLALTNSGSVLGDIYVLAANILDVTGRTDGGLTIGPSQTLKGQNTFFIMGNVTNQGTIELNIAKTGFIANDSLFGPTHLAYGGTLNLVLSGDPLTSTDTIKLFDATSYSGSFAAINPATPGPGLVWDISTLATDGTLRIGAVMSFTSTTVSGTDLIMSGSGGTASGGYSVLSSTNVAEPLTSWSVVQTGNFDASGNFSVTNAIAPGETARFFILRVP